MEMLAGRRPSCLNTASSTSTMVVFPQPCMRAQAWMRQALRYHGYHDSPVTLLPQQHPDIAHCHHPVRLVWTQEFVINDS